MKTGAQIKNLQGILFTMLLTLPFILSQYAAAAGDASQQSETRAIAASLPRDAKTSERIFGLHGLPNVGRVAPGIFRGGQPLAEGYHTLKKMGIRTVINLRYSHSERAVVEAQVMKSIEIPINTIAGVDKKTVDRIIDIMADPSLQPVYLHCAFGAGPDRDCRGGIPHEEGRLDASRGRSRDAVLRLQRHMDQSQGFYRRLRGKQINSNVGKRTCSLGA